MIQECIIIKAIPFFARTGEYCFVINMPHKDALKRGSVDFIYSNWLFQLIYVLVLNFVLFAPYVRFHIFGLVLVTE